MNPAQRTHRSQETREIADGWLDRGSRDERELEAALRLAMSMRRRQEHASDRSTHSYSNLISQASTSVARTLTAATSGVSSMTSGDDGWGPPPLFSTSASPIQGPGTALLVAGGDSRGSYESRTFMGEVGEILEASQSLPQYQYRQHRHQQQQQQSRSQQKQRHQRHQRQQLQQYGNNRLGTEISVDSHVHPADPYHEMSELELEVWGTKSPIKHDPNKN